MDIVCPTLIDGQLAAITDYHKIFLSTEYKDIFSIIDYNFESGMVELKMNSGENITVDLKNIENKIYRGCLHGKIQDHVKTLKFTIAFGNLLVSIFDGDYREMIFTICSEIVQHMSKVMDSENGFKVLFKDGRIEEFTVNPPSYQVISSSGQVYDLTPNYANQPLYCQRGELKRIGILDSKVFTGRVCNYLLVRAETGDYYSFRLNRNPPPVVKFPGCIYELDDVILFNFINDDVPTDIMIRFGIKLGTTFPDDWLDTAPAMNLPLMSLYPFNRPYILYDEKFLTAKSGKIKAIHQDLNGITAKYDDEDVKLSAESATDPDVELIVVDNNISTLTYAPYYVCGDGTVLEYTHVKNFNIYKHNGKYYDAALMRLNVTQYKLPVSNAHVLDVFKLQNNNGAFIINMLWPVLGPIAQYIENIEMLYDFSIYSMLVTMKSGEKRRCCLVSPGPVLLAFEDGEVAPLRVPDVYYSKNGPYKLLTPAEYEKISSGIYRVRGNIVVFDLLSDITEIYESFGDYLGVHNNACAHGTVVIRGQPKRTKPALC